MTLATVQPGTQAISFTVEHEYRHAVPSGIRPVPLHGPMGGSRLAEGNDKDHEKRIKAWKRDVAWSARMAYSGRPVEGPVAVEITDLRKRPASHYGTGKNAGVLKDSAPRYPVTTPDCDKTGRLITDAMSGVLYADDAQIVEERMIKLYAPYGTEPHVEVTVWVLDAVQTLSLEEIVARAA